MADNQVPQTYTSKISYLLTLPFPEETIILGKTKDAVLRSLYKENNPHSISKSLNISRPTTIQHLEELRKKGLTRKGENNEANYGDLWKITDKGKFLIEKCVGFPVISSHKGKLSPTTKVRGHGFIWKIKPNKNFDWKFLIDEKKIDYVLKGFSRTPRILIGNKKTWLGHNYITIFLPKEMSFFAKNPSKSRNNAIYELTEDIEKLKELFGISFEYKFTCRRQHYGFVDNPEAKFFIKKKKKILIKNEKGYWFSVDFSQNKYQEAEVLKDNDELMTSNGYQNYMNSHERTKFKVTAEFILNALNQVSQNQVVFDKNIEKHQKVLEEMSQTLKEIRDSLKR